MNRYFIPLLMLLALFVPRSLLALEGGGMWRPLSQAEVAQVSAGQFQRVAVGQWTRSDGLSATVFRNIVSLKLHYHPDLNQYVVWAYLGPEYLAGPPVAAVAPPSTPVQPWPTQPAVAPASPPAAPIPPTFVQPAPVQPAPVQPVPPSEAPLRVKYEYDSYKLTNGQDDEYMSIHLEYANQMLRVVVGDWMKENEAGFFRAKAAGAGPFTASDGTVVPSYDFIVNQAAYGITAGRLLSWGPHRVPPQSIQIEIRGKVFTLTRNDEPDSVINPHVPE